MLDHSSVRVELDDAKVSPLRVVIVTNIPTPYRLPVYEILAKAQDILLKVVYCCEREPNRNWDLSSRVYEAEYLKERFFTIGNHFVHVNPDVFGVLRRFKPDVVIGTGFNPTHLLAFIYSRLSRCVYVPMTDGTLGSEQVLSVVHRWIRRRVYRRSGAFIAASDGGFDLYKSYGVGFGNCFKSHLCANNEAFACEPVVKKKFDLIFSGRFAAVKNPLFVFDVAKLVSLRLGRKVSLAFLGSGEFEAQMRLAADELTEYIDSYFLGFAQQADLPGIYGAARVMLFPTLWDPWGIVANESLAAGVPVVVSPVAGAANELVCHQLTGFVVPLEIERWADAVEQLLTDSDLCSRMGEAGKLIVNEYTYENAALGIANAARRAAGRHIVQKNKDQPVLS